MTQLQDHLAAMETHIESLGHRLTLLTWVIGVGFSLMMALLLLEVNWLWQILQRLQAHA